MAGKGRPDRGEGRTSLSFSEEMKGFYSAGHTTGQPRSHTTGHPLGHTTGLPLGDSAGLLGADAEHTAEAADSGAAGTASTRSALSFRLSITIDDVRRFIAEPDHLASAEGWVDAPGCGGRRPVEAGWFNLFTPTGSPDRRLMRYRLHFTDSAGRPHTLFGWKNVQHGPLTDIWPDTSTLFFRLLEGHVAEGEDDHARILGTGTLRLELDDFVRQLTTFRTAGPNGPAALARFGAFFVGRLWEVYGPRSTATADTMHENQMERADRKDQAHAVEGTTRT